MTTTKKDGFYIGYLDNMPARYSMLLRKMLIGIFLGLIILAYVLVRSQQGFATSTFELGNSTEVEGILTIEPVPMLTLPQSAESILLIGYGKFGAETTLLQALGSEFKRNSQYRVRMQGTLIYHDGKTLLELTSKTKSMIEWSLIEEDKIKASSLGQIEVTGEIIDPKCYFGVMKPGEGKPHRSCAIRCISGGIPPVIKVSNTLGQSNYFLLRGENGQPVNEMVLDYVAEPVRISGQGYQYHNWMILNIDESTGIKPIQ